MKSTQKSPDTWITSDINDILQLGHILYTHIGKVCKLLLPSDIPQYMSVDGMNYKAFEETSHIGSFRCTRHGFNMKTFEMLGDVLIVHKYFLMCIGSSAISVIHLNETYYICDPYGRNMTGFPDHYRTAVLLTFKSLKGNEQLY